MFNIHTLKFVHAIEIGNIYSDFFYKIKLFIDKKIKSLLIFSFLILHHNFNQIVPQIYTDFNKFSKIFEFFLENNVFFSECLILSQFLSVKNQIEFVFITF